METDVRIILQAHECSLNRGLMSRKGGIILSFSRHTQILITANDLYIEYDKMSNVMLSSSHHHKSN